MSPDSAADKRPAQRRPRPRVAAAAARAAISAREYDGREVPEWLRDAAADDGSRRRRASKVPAGSDLPNHEAAVLEESGFVTDPGAATAAQMDRDVRMQTLVKRSLSIADAAERLGVSTARIRQRLTDGTLWAFDSGRSRLMPPAQFTEAGGVPHLEKVLPLIAKDLHPLTVQALLTVPQPSLTVEGRSVSIVEWLTGSAGRTQDIEQAANVISAAAWESA